MILGPPSLQGSSSLSQMHMHWYEPCATERAVCNRYFTFSTSSVGLLSHDCYLAFPWATWIDFLFTQKRTDAHVESITQQIRSLQARMEALRDISQAVSGAPRFHTVCQHVYWKKFLPIWAQLGVTDLWLSHCERGMAGTIVDGITLHAWSLYAVNIEVEARRIGLQIGRPQSHRTLLASFSGAQLPFYISDIRDRLPLLNDYPGFEVYVNSEWHFESQVQANQKGEKYEPDPIRDIYEVESYNQQLSDSVFALCPSGSGPNSIRLWEALAVGTIPVLMGVLPELPVTQEVSQQMWSQAVIEFTDSDLTRLPGLLNSISPQERLARQTMCMTIYNHLRNMTCF